MKKAIIITAIIFIISSVLCVCLGVAEGAKFIRDYDKGKFSEEINDIGDFVRKITSGGDFSENFTDISHENIKSNIEQLFEGRDFSIFGQYENIIGSEKVDGIDISGKTEIKIKADVGSVKIVGTDDGTMSASYDIYSRKADADASAFSLGTDTNGYDIYASGDKDVKAACLAELTVEIPSDFEGKVTVECNIGEIAIDSAEFKAVSAEVQTGSIEIADTVAESAELNVHTGEIEILSESGGLTLVNAKVGTGSIEYTVPFNGKTEIDYSVHMGSAELDGLNPREYDLTSGGISESGDGTIVIGESEDGNYVKANLTVDMGSIEFNT
ncbi:MAG: hypothetical protein E7514_01190 [Ruminococcaceae bacterium]|nr:hypothetical protein [Oscillospiraceae bacterium]